MEYKINKKTRIKITHRKLHEFKDDSSYIFSSQFFIDFQLETGLSCTSNKFQPFVGTVYYFEVKDKNKYLLAKIKYGI